MTDNVSGEYPDRYFASEKTAKMKPPQQYQKKTDKDPKWRDVTFLWFMGEWLC